MDYTSMFIIIVLFSLIGYLIYSRIKMRNILMELEYTVEELHKRVEEHEGLNLDEAHKGKRKK